MNLNVNSNYAVGMARKGSLADKFGYETSDEYARKGSLADKFGFETSDEYARKGSLADKLGAETSDEYAIGTARKGSLDYII